MFVAMPSRMPSGEFKDIAHPIKPELRKDITDAVSAKFQELNIKSETFSRKWITLCRLKLSKPVFVYKVFDSKKGIDKIKKI